MVLKRRILLSSASYHFQNSRAVTQHSRIAASLQTYPTLQKYGRGNCLGRCTQTQTIQTVVNQMY